MIDLRQRRQTITPYCIQSLGRHSELQDRAPQTPQIKRETATDADQFRIGILAQRFCLSTPLRRDQVFLKKGREVETDFIKSSRDPAGLAALEVALDAELPIDVIVPEPFECVIVTIYICRNKLLDPLAAGGDSTQLLHVEISRLERLSTQHLEVHIAQLWIGI